MRSTGKASWWRVWNKAAPAVLVGAFLLPGGWMVIAGLVTGEYGWLIWGIVLTAGILALVLATRLMGIDLLPKPYGEERECGRDEIARREVMRTGRTRARWRRVLGRAVTDFLLRTWWTVFFGALTGEYGWLVWGIVLTAGILALVLAARLLGIDLLSKPYGEERECGRDDIRIDVVVVVSVRVDQGVTFCWLLVEYAFNSNILLRYGIAVVLRHSPQ